jgi:hypothetical protein
MVDIAFLGVPLLIAIIVMLRKTSAGVAVLGLLAGVMLDQLLGTWIVDLLPSAASSASEYIPLGIHLLVTFAPMVASLAAVKVHKHSPILSILTSLLLGFLIVYFALELLEPIAAVEAATKKAGLLSFIRPYHNAILAASAILAIIEMIASHRTGVTHSKKKKKKD